MIVDPPLLTGGVKLMVASPLPATAVTLVGAPGVVNGVTEFELEEAEPVPTVLVAVTVKV